MLFLVEPEHRGKIGGVTVSFHNTLASSEYGLLDQNTFASHPNYWAALLWHKPMGTKVVDARPSRPGLHVYAQCMGDHPGGVTLLVINNRQTQPISMNLPMAVGRYTLSAQELEDRVQLNGKEFALGADDALLALQGSRIPAGEIALAPASISFLAMENAGNANCR